MVFGSAQTDNIATGGGNDSVLAGDGTDTAWGGTGNDYLDMGAGNDRGSGADGGDTVLGGEGNDEVTGEADNDVIYGGAGNNFIRVHNESQFDLDTPDLDDFSFALDDETTGVQLVRGTTVLAVLQGLSATDIPAIKLLITEPTAGSLPEWSP
jgi:Ca2+-binding RTX toxin-like protein